MDVHLDITDDRDVYVEEDNNMEVEKEVNWEVDEGGCPHFVLL